MIYPIRNKAVVDPQRSNSHCRRRSGLTLLELIIVMVILVAVAALSVPTVQRSFSAQKLIKAADLVRGELNRARVRSMRTGEIHAFFYQPESPQFTVSPFNSETAKILSESFQRDQGKTSSNFDYDTNKLPNGIYFSSSEAVEDARAMSAKQDNPTAAGNMQPILFYPDGSSQTAKVYIRSEDSDVAEIRLRGLTGTSTSSIVDTKR